jgi:hypothetical protein
MGTVLWLRTGEELSILRGEALILLPDALFVRCSGCKKLCDAMALGLQY